MEEDIVLDAFIGARTTALAAKRLGRQYIGIDVDGNYVDEEESSPHVETVCYGERPLLFG